MPGDPGCVIVRLIGAAAFGAVAVGGGAANVLEPREPMLMLGRASASAITIVNTAASANSANKGRKSLIHSLPEPGRAYAISGSPGPL
jgi:hypothetical protein